MVVVLGVGFVFTFVLVEIGVGCFSGRDLSVGVEFSGRRDVFDIFFVRSYDLCVCIYRAFRSSVIVRRLVECYFCVFRKFLVLVSWMLF